FVPATRRDPSYWYWEIGAKERELRGESVFYAFVDLKLGKGEPPTPMPTPDVFVVPADVVATMRNDAFPKLTKDERTTWVGVWGEPPKQQRYFFHIEADENRKEKEKKYWESWHLIEEALGTNRVGNAE